MEEEKKEEKPETEQPKSLESWLRIDGEIKTEEEFCAWIRAQVEEHPVVKVHHGKWKELIEWREGNQYTKWAEDKRAVVPAQLTQRKTLIVVNVMKPLVETIEGKIDFFHKIAGVPNSTEQKDIHGAEVATRLIEFNDDVNDMPDLKEELKYDLFNTGNSCEKWIYDKSAHGYMGVKDNGKYDDSKKQKTSGEVIGRVVPIFNIRPDPTAKTVEDCRWFIEIYEATVEDILKTYPKISRERLNMETADDSVGSNKYAGMNEPIEEKDKEQKTRIVSEFWERPSEWYKSGRMIVTVDNIVAYTKENTCPGSDLPYFMFYYHKTPYSFWAKGPLHYVQDSQRSLNRMTSMMVEHVESWRPKMTVGQGALKTAGSITLDPCEIVEVDYSRGVPQAMSMPALQPQVAELRDFFIASVDRVSNIHEVSYSRLPQYASRAPASLYSMMLEQESMKLGPMVTKWNKTIRHVAKFRLMLMDKYYDQPRMVKIMGENKKTKIDYFEATDLSGNFDVRLEIGVTLNQSTTVQMRTLLEFYQNGIITDKNKVIRAAHLGIAEQEFVSGVVDSDRAMRENQAFQDGKQSELKQFPVPPKLVEIMTQIGIPMQKTEVYIHDDHEEHIGMHTDILKSEDAVRWPDDRFKNLDNHVTVHFLYLQASMQMQKEPPTQPAGQDQGSAERAVQDVEGGAGIPGPVPEEGPSMGPAIEGGSPGIPAGSAV